MRRVFQSTTNPSSIRIFKSLLLIMIIGSSLASSTFLVNAKNIVVPVMQYPVTPGSSFWLMDSVQFRHGTHTNDQARLWLREISVTPNGDTIDVSLLYETLSRVQGKAFAVVTFYSDTHLAVGSTRHKLSSVCGFHTERSTEQPQDLKVSYEDIAYGVVHVVYNDTEARWCKGKGKQYYSHYCDPIAYKHRLCNVSWQ